MDEMRRQQLGEEFAQAVANLPDDWDLGTHLDNLPDPERSTSQSFRAGLVRAQPSSVPGVLASFTASDYMFEPDWQVTGTVVVQDGQMVIAELTLQPDPNGTGPLAGGIDRKVLSQVRPSELLRGVRQSLAEFERRVTISQERHGDLAAYQAMARRAAEGAASAAVVPRPGRKGHDVALYRDLAFRYLALQKELKEQSKSARGVIGLLMREPWPIDLERGLTRIPRDTVKSRLRKCEQLGFLEFVREKTRPGADVGPNLLEENIEEDSK